MPMRRRTRRNALRESPTSSTPSNSICPALGSTRRLMQRISVLLPVPDGPMIAVMPRAAMSRLTSFKTGLPGTYDLARCLRVSMEDARTSRFGRSSQFRHHSRESENPESCFAKSLDPRLRGDDAAVSDRRDSLASCSRAAASPFLRRLRRLPRCFLFVRGLVEAPARALRDVANDRPGRPVVDREEPIGTVEGFLHFRREAVFVEAVEYSVYVFVIEVVGVCERRCRVFLSAVVDPEYGVFY